MAKKKTNGFHLFANSRRIIYEAHAGRRLSHKMLLELASVEWKNLTKEEQTAWLSRPKVPANQHLAKVPLSAVSLPIPSISRVALVTATQANQKKSHFVEQELFKRTYKCGLDRQTAREEFYGNLLWREKDHLDDLINRRWGIVVLSPDGVDMANEIVCVCVEDSKIVAEMRIHRPDAHIFEEDRLHAMDCLWNIENPEDINTACIRMNRFIQGCCYNYILVPAHQQSELSAILHLMKETRDKLHDRDTQSIRLDRLICIEDAVAMLRKLKNLPMVNNEIDLRWEQLTGEWNMMTTVEYSHAVAEYFLSSLEPETAFFEEVEQMEEQLEGTEERVEMEMGGCLDAVTPENTCYAEFPKQANLGNSMVDPPLTPPLHISPRARRSCIPRKWCNRPESSSTSFTAMEAGSPTAPTKSNDWDRPNPFSLPPQLAQDSRDAIFQSVSRWLENISLDPTPAEEELYLEETSEDMEEVK